MPRKATRWFNKTEKFDGKVYAFHSSYIKKTGSLPDVRKGLKQRKFLVRTKEIRGSYALYIRKPRGKK